MLIKIGFFSNAKCNFLFFYFWFWVEIVSLTLSTNKNVFVTNHDQSLFVLNVNRDFNKVNWKHFKSDFNLLSYLLFFVRFVVFQTCLLQFFEECLFLALTKYWALSQHFNMSDRWKAFYCHVTFFIMISLTFTFKYVFNDYGGCFGKFWDLILSESRIFLSGYNFVSLQPLKMVCTLTSLNSLDAVHPQVYLRAITAIVWCMYLL